VGASCETIVSGRCDNLWSKRANLSEKSSLRLWGALVIEIAHGKGRVINVDLFVLILEAVGRGGLVVVLSCLVPDSPNAEVYAMQKYTCALGS